MYADILGLTEEQFLGFFLAFVRISALVAVAPFFGSRTVPVKVKVFLSLILTIAIMPIIKSTVDVTQTRMLALVPLTAKEAFIGMFLGFNAKLMFESFSFAGRLISRQMGLGLSQLVDPESGAQVTPIGTIFGLTAVILFLQLDGHHLLLSALYKSFEILPAGGAMKIAGPGEMKMLTMFNELFVIGVKIAAPSMVILFLVEVSMGIIARIVPQMNIFFVGLPLRLGVGLFAVIVSLPVFFMLFETMFHVWTRDVRGLLIYF